MDAHQSKSSSNRASSPAVAKIPVQQEPQGGVLLLLPRTVLRFANCLHSEITKPHLLRRPRAWRKCEQAQLLRQHGGGGSSSWNLPRIAELVPNVPIITRVLHAHRGEWRASKLTEMVWPHSLSARSRPSVPWRPKTSQSPVRGRSSVQAAVSSSRGAVVALAGASVGSVAAPFAFGGLQIFLGFAVAPFASAAFKRLFGRRRRPRRPAPATMSDGVKAVFSVASFNLRGKRTRFAY